MAGGKRPNKSPTVGQDVKKSTSTTSKTPSRHVKGEDTADSLKSEEEDSDEDLMDRLAKRKSVPPSSGSGSKKALIPKSNGAKRHAVSPPPSKKSKTHHPKKPRGKEVASSDDGSMDDDVESPANEEVRHLGEDDQEECSARVCKKPTGAPIDWIQCDKCTKWYHQICLSLTAEEANVEKYFCPSCVKKR